MAEAVYPLKLPVVNSLPSASAFTNRMVVYAGKTYFSDGTNWTELGSGGGGGGLNYDVWHVLNPVNANTWYIPYAIGCTALTTLALTSNRIYYIPFTPLRNVSLTSLAVEVTTASAGTGQVGVYDSTTNFRPNSLLASINIDTGATGVKSGTVSLSLTTGQLYWLALINSSAATIRAVAVGGTQAILGIATGGTAWNTHYHQAGSGGTLPSTAGANTNGTGSVPAIYIRYSNA